MDSNHPSTANVSQPGWQQALEVLKRSAIWGLFFVVLYLARDFFFLAFMTFIFSYLALTLINGIMHRAWPGKEMPGMRRLITLGVFLCLPVILVSIGIVVMPHLVAQTQHLIGWASHVNPEIEVSRLLEGFVGHSEFEQEFGNAQDPRYQKALADFQKKGERYVKQYLEFPSLEAWVEGSFKRQFADSQRSTIRASLLNEGVSSQQFEEWFIASKYPELQSQARKANDSLATSATKLARASTQQQALHMVRHDPGLQAAMLQDWINDTVEQKLAVANRTASYREQFQKHYESRRAQKPGLVPYSFDEFLVLQQARAQGQRAFGEAMAKLRPITANENDTQLKADFEASTRHEMFLTWWNTSSPARFIRHEIESNTTGNVTGRMEGILTSLLDIPLDLCTALLLSLLICIDYPAMKRASQRLRETWLRDVYDEIVPALASLARLVGTAMYAQGLIALCNALLIFFGLMFLGVDHVALLSVAVFILCLVPTLGTIIAWVLIVIVALVQPGGGIVLAAKATGVVVVVIILETFVFSPRILGKLMELHPVLIIAILPVAHAFFGIWGLLLAIPVSVYVINTVILGRDAAETEPEATGVSHNI